jgi:tetratricopeptide (TPR) repeat protein
MRNLALVCVALVVVILAVYIQVGNHEFVNYDDESYVTKNPHVASGITGKNVMWAFTSVHSANWHPITWLSHMADAQLYGMNPRGHHLTNVAIHIVSTLLLLLLLLRLTGALWPSAFVAALFALHPLHVESVAWVAERKDVLSAFFWFLTLITYAEFTEKRKPALYFLALLFFMLGLMSKPMLVTLPVVMLLMDFWPLDRFRPGDRETGLSQLFRRGITLIKEKIPFFACSLASCIVTMYAQTAAMSDLDVVSVPLRIGNALIAYVKYIGNMLWPHDLAMLYPYPRSLPLWQAISSLLVLLLVSGATVRSGRKYPYLAVGWFWYLVTLLPVIGLIQVGSQSMADRYTYIPLIGLFVMAAWGVRDLTKNLPYREGILALLASAVIITSAALTWQQTGYWRDSMTLYRHTLLVTTDNYLIHYNMGLTLERQRDMDGAIREYQETLRINPGYKQAHGSLGTVLDGKGELDAAMQEYHEALLIDPDYKDVHNNLGLALSHKGDLDGAIREYREALRIDPDYKEAHNNLGVAFGKKGYMDAAIQEFHEALRINPDDSEAHGNLGLALAGKGDLAAAIREYREAIRINPKNEKARKSLELALGQKVDR